MILTPLYLLRIVSRKLQKVFTKLTESASAVAGSFGLQLVKSFVPMPTQTKSGFHDVKFHAGVLLLTSVRWYSEQMVESDVAGVQQSRTNPQPDLAISTYSALQARAARGAHDL
jgi:hypothetical protein